MISHSALQPLRCRFDSGPCLQPLVYGPVAKLVKATPGQGLIVGSSPTRAYNHNRFIVQSIVRIDKLLVRNEARV